MRPAVAFLLVIGALAWSPVQEQAPVQPLSALEPQAGRAARPEPGRAPRDAAVPFSPGETLVYDVSWSSFVVAGTATSRVVDKRPSSNSTAYSIVVEGRPVPLVARLYNLYYKMETMLDSVALLSHRGSLYSEEGSSRSLVTTRFDRSARRAFFERQADTADKIDIIVPTGTQDGLAFLYSLRSRALKTGARFSVPVADGGSLYAIQVEVGALEPVRVPAGAFTGWNLKVGITDAQNEAVWKNSELWISNDGRRLPLKMQAELPVGHFVLVLRSAT